MHRWEPSEDPQYPTAHREGGHGAGPGGGGAGLYLHDADGTPRAVRIITVGEKQRQVKLSASEVLRKRGLAH